MNEENYLLFLNRSEWRSWLKKNHGKVRRVFLLFYKKNSGKKSIKYNEAVEEALCFGWIDSKVKRLDGEAYIQQYSPRKSGSVWSKINKERVVNLIEAGKMTEAGMRLVEDAKKSGWWEMAYSTTKESHVLPDDLKESLEAEKDAWRNFNSFRPSKQAAFIMHVNSAKRPETRRNRIAWVVDNCLKKVLPGNNVMPPAENN